jgi:hypothetical protein
MKRKLLLISFLLFLNIFYTNSHPRFYPYYPYPYPYPYYNEIIIIHAREIYTHRLGNIYLDKNIEGDANDIDKITFGFGINGSFERVQEKEIIFTDNGAEKIQKTLISYLEKADIPDKFPEFDNLSSYSSEEGILKLKFVNNNFCRRYNSSDSEDQYYYTLNYSFVLPYSENVKSQFDELNGRKFRDEVDKFLDRQRKMKTAGIVTFTTGIGLFGILNVASLITLYNAMVFKDVPMIVPGSLFFSGLGAVSISLGVGVPLWAASSVKKKFEITFGK